MIRVGDIVRPRGSRREFLVQEHDIMRQEWILEAMDTGRFVRVSDALAMTIQPIGRDDPDE